jgi:NADPH2:quinone reductase
MKNKRIVLTGFGGVENLELQTTDAPSPGAGELLVRVEFAGVAFADVMQRLGKYPGAPRLPYTPGYDVVGLVQARGDDTTTPIGTRVGALTRFGGYAQYVVVKEAGVAPVPATVDPAKAVCLVLNYLSAYQMLIDVAHLNPGDAVLIHGAAGGVGTAALQLGATMGLCVLGTASTAKQDVVRSLGAYSIDYQQSDFVAEVRETVPQGVRAVLDPIGPANWKRSKRCLERGGHLVAFGGVGLMDRQADRLRGGTMTLLGAALALKLFSPGIKFSFYGVSVGDLERTRRDLEVLFKLASDGRIDPLVSDSLPLSDAAEAHRRLSAADVRGKLVLDCT